MLRCLTGEGILTRLIIDFFQEGLPRKGSPVAGERGLREEWNLLFLPTETKEGLICMSSWGAMLGGAYLVHERSGLLIKTS